MWIGGIYVREGIMDTLPESVDPCWTALCAFIRDDIPSRAQGGRTAQVDPWGRGLKRWWRAAELLDAWGILGAPCLALRADVLA
jgi:hypothetical protein